MQRRWSGQRKSSRDILHNTRKQLLSPFSTWVSARTRTGPALVSWTMSPSCSKCPPCVYTKSRLSTLCSTGPSSPLFCFANHLNAVYSEPIGENFVQVCTTTPCMLRGSGEILDTVCKHLGGVKPGHTTADGKWTVVEVECQGACSNAPMVVIGDDFYVRYVWLHTFENKRSNVSR